MKRQNKINIGIISAIIIVAALSRLLFVMIPNFSPIGAIALFGAAYFSKKYLAFLIPLAAMWISDLLINNMIYPRMFPEYYDGNFAWGVSWWVYGAFALVVVLGFVLFKREGIRQSINVKNIAVASLLTAIVFFLVTNFGVWAGGNMYPKTITGLMLCYEAAIPFFWNTLISNFFFSAILFGGYELLNRRVFAFSSNP
ncbi:MAG: DUF6580 family putative transport protein [Bacteroidota bacterium]